jgi:surface polysaccharide O-acyltransferase-like enzyme
MLQKNNTIQLIRALAIIAVVMIHTTPSGMYQVFCRPFINYAVATFLFLSGFLTKIDNDNWISFYKKRIKRVLIPYLIWTVLYTLSSKNIGKLPNNLITAKAAAPLYYIFVYIQFVLLTPLMGKLAKSKFCHLGWLIAPVSVIVFKYYWLLTGTQLNSHINLIWVDSCLGWFTFYYLGLLLGNGIIKKEYSLKVLMIFYLVSILFQMAEGYGWLLLGEVNCGSQVKLSSYLTSSLFLLIIYSILQKGCEYRNSLIRVIGDYSFGIYLCHIMVLRYVTILNAVPYPINSAIVVLLSLFICYIGDRFCGGKVSKVIGFR